MVNTILAKRVNHIVAKGGQSCLAKGVKVAWLFQQARAIQKALNLCFKTDDALTYTALVKAYALEATVSEATAKRHIRTAKENEFLVLSGDMYTLVSNRHDKVVSSITP